MGSSFVLALIMLVVSGASLVYLIAAEGGVGEIPQLLERAGITADIEFPQLDLQKLYNSRPSRAVPPQFQSGTSRFSQGTCVTGADCHQTGCSAEVCSNDPDIITTCEYSDRFPNRRDYSCTCLPAGVCGWQ